MNTTSSYYNIFLIMVAILMFTTGGFQNSNASKVDTNKDISQDFVFSLPFNSHIADSSNNLKTYINDIIPFP
ncbi:MAG TPA: hypothetical protein VN703_06735 [Candidatus Sulfopaludibacter sp.]|jgi:hypothetical protein|nr:hypothetical protein [Candidatus Sulfopaludibacter sp.]